MVPMSTENGQRWCCQLNGINESNRKPKNQPRNYQDAGIWNFGDFCWPKKWL